MVVERHRLKPVLTRAPVTWAAVRHVVRDLGLGQHLADELRSEPVGVSGELAGVAPGLEGLEGEVVLVVVPDVTAEQRERHTLGVELGLHGPVLLPLRAHASVTVTQCLLLLVGLSPLKTFILYHSRERIARKLCVFMFFYVCPICTRIVHEPWFE